MVYGANAFLMPTLSLHLLSYPGFDEFLVAMFFGVPAIIFILNTPLVSIYCRVWTRRGVVFVGVLLFAVSILLIGTSPLFNIPDLPKLIFFGLCLNSFSAAMVVIPIFPEMLHSIESEFPTLAGDELNNVSAGYFNSCVSVGEAIGPALASLMTSKVGFRTSEDAVACILFVFVICYFWWAGKFKLFKLASASVDSDDDYRQAEGSTGGATILRQRRKSSDLFQDYATDQNMKQRRRSSLSSP